MVCKCVCVAVRPDAGRVGRSQRELYTCGGAGAGCQRSAATVQQGSLCHSSARRDRPLPKIPYQGFCLFF